MGKMLEFVQKNAGKAAQKRMTALALRMAAQIPNQETLDDVLLREPDEVRRNTLFEFMRPVLRFANPRCPEMPKRIIEC